MKITKLKNSYRIRCNDSDFAMLEALTDMLPPELVRRSLEGGAKGAYTRRTKGGGLFRVVVDKSM